MEYRDTMSKKSKRLVGVIVRTCLWAIPVGVIGACIYHRLPDWCNTYWHVAETRAVADQWADRVRQAGQPVVWNPGSILIYIRALLMNMTAGTQAAVQGAIAQTVSGIGRILVGVFGVWFVWRIICLIKKNYRQKSRDQALVRETCQVLMPELISIREQLAEIQKKLSQTEQPKN